MERGAGDDDGRGGAGRQPLRRGPRHDHRRERLEGPRHAPSRSAGRSRSTGRRTPPGESLRPCNRAVAQAAGGARGAAMPFRPRDERGSARARHLRRRHRAVRSLRAPVGQAVPRGPARVGADRGRHRHRGRDGAARRGALVHARRRVLGGRPRGRGRNAGDRAGPLRPHRGGGLAGPRDARRAEPAAPARAARAARAAVRARLGRPHLGRPLGAGRGGDGARRAPTASSSTRTSRSDASSASAARCWRRGRPSPTSRPRPRPRRARRARSRPGPGR